MRIKTIKKETPIMKYVNLKNKQNQKLKRNRKKLNLWQENVKILIKCASTCTLMREFNDGAKKVRNGEVRIKNEINRVVTE